MKKRLFCITILLFATICIGGTVFDCYDTHRIAGRSKTINPFYEGPLYMTGGADAELNRYIATMSPEKIGYVAPNKIVFFGDETNEEETYAFKRVKLYRVVKDTDTFHVNYIRALRDGKPYEIIIEFTDGPNYDRVLWIYKNQKPHTMVLWREKIKIIPIRKSVL